VNHSWSHLGGGALRADEEAWLRALRHSLSSLSPADAWEAVTKRLISTSSNAELIGKS
jgi:hypothetical protein